MSRAAYWSAYHARHRERRSAAAAARYAAQKVRPDDLMRWVVSWRLRRQRACLRALGVA